MDILFIFAPPWYKNKTATVIADTFTSFYKILRRLPLISPEGSSIKVFTNIICRKWERQNIPNRNSTSPLQRPLNSSAYHVQPYTHVSTPENFPTTRSYHAPSGYRLKEE